MPGCLGAWVPGCLGAWVAVALCVYVRVCGCVSVAVCACVCGSRLLTHCRLTRPRFLLNGGVIHFLMDGMVGTFGAWPLMKAQYNQLDKVQWVALTVAASCDGTVCC